jgi:hypothetical protein
MLRISASGDSMEGATFGTQGLSIRFSPFLRADHAGKLLKHFLPADLRSPERLFAPWLGDVKAEMLEEDASSVSVGFESVAYPHNDARAAGPRVREPTGRFAFQNLATYDAIKTCVFFLGSALLRGGLASIGPADGEAATQEFSIGAGSGQA